MYSNIKKNLKVFAVSKNCLNTSECLIKKFFGELF